MMWIVIKYERPLASWDDIQVVDWHIVDSEGLNSICLKYYIAKPTPFSDGHYALPSIYASELPIVYDKGRSLLSSSERAELISLWRQVQIDIITS